MGQTVEKPQGLWGCLEKLHPGESLKPRNYLKANLRAQLKNGHMAIMAMADGKTNMAIMGIQ